MFLTSYLKLLLQQVQFLCKEAERVLNLMKVYLEEIDN